MHSSKKIDSTLRLGDEEGGVLVTVVVPAYNHESYVSECIQSILDQDYPWIDLIVIDDGSTDRTGQRIQEILDKEPSRFRYISKKNEGLIKTLNLGLSLADGEYFCEVASDDVLLPGSIRNRLNCLLEHAGTDVVFADAYLLDGEVRTTIRMGVSKRWYDSLTHSLEDLICGRARLMFPTGMFKKAVLEEMGGFDEDFRFYEDLAMKYQLALSYCIGYLNEPIMYRRIHQTNTSSTQKYWVRKEKILGLEKLLTLEIGHAHEAAKKCLRQEYAKFFKFALSHPVERSDLQAVFDKAVRFYPTGLKIRYYMMRNKMKRFLKGA